VLHSYLDELTEIFEDYEDGDAFDQLVGDIRGDLSLITEGAISVRLEGQWVHGVFTGDASIRTKETSFNGNFANGVREGHGYEYDMETGRLSLGEWHLGRRHGWCLMGQRDAELTRMDAVAIEKWSHGSLVAQWEIMTASRIREAVANGHAAIRITQDDSKPCEFRIEHNVSVADDASDSTHIGEGVWYAIKK
jgi:hypothetical protein